MRLIESISVRALISIFLFQRLPMESQLFTLIDMLKVLVKVSFWHWFMNLSYLCKPFLLLLKISILLFLIVLLNSIKKGLFMHYLLVFSIPLSDFFFSSFLLFLEPFHPLLNLFSLSLLFLFSFLFLLKFKLLLSLLLLKLTNHSLLIFYPLYFLLLFFHFSQKIKPLLIRKYHFLSWLLPTFAHTP